MAPHAEHLTKVIGPGDLPRSDPSSPFLIKALPAEMMDKWNRSDLVRPGPEGNPKEFAQKLSRVRADEAYMILGPAWKSDSVFHHTWSLRYYALRQEFLPQTPEVEGFLPSGGIRGSGSFSAVAFGFPGKPPGNPFPHTVGYYEYMATPKEKGGGGKEKEFGNRSGFIIAREDAEIFFAVYHLMFRPRPGYERGMTVPLEGSSDPVNMLKGPAKILPMVSAIVHQDAITDLFCAGALPELEGEFGVRFLGDLAMREQEDAPTAWDPWADPVVMEYKARVNLSFEERMVEVSRLLPRSHPGFWTHVRSRGRAAESLPGNAQLELRAMGAACKYNEDVEFAATCRTRDRKEMNAFYAGAQHRRAGDVASQERTIGVGKQEIFFGVVRMNYGTIASDKTRAAMVMPAIMYNDERQGGFRLIRGDYHNLATFFCRGLNSSGNDFTSSFSTASNMCDRAVEARRAGVLEPVELSSGKGRAWKRWLPGLTRLFKHHLRHTGGKYLAYKTTGDNAATVFGGGLDDVDQPYAPLDAKTKFLGYALEWQGEPGGALLAFADAERIVEGLICPTRDWGPRRGNPLLSEEDKLRHYFENGTGTCAKHWALFVQSVEDTSNMTWPQFKRHAIDADIAWQMEEYGEVDPRYFEVPKAVSDADRAFLMNPDGYHYGRFNIEDVTAALRLKVTHTFDPAMTRHVLGRMYAAEKRNRRLSPDGRQATSGPFGEDALEACRVYDPIAYDFVRSTLSELGLDYFGLTRQPGKQTALAKHGLVQRFEDFSFDELIRRSTGGGERKDE